MPPNDDTLENLRGEIDTIDDALHDLLMERAAVVMRVAAAKSGPALRPGREAAILRRLVERHGGAFPRAALVRIWREIMGASVGLQETFKLAVYTPADDPGYLDIARDHFGTVAETTVNGSAREILRAVASGAAAVGVVPTPVVDEEDPWWRSLVGAGDAAPRVIAKLPFAGGDPAKGLEALALALAEPAETGEDRSLVVVEYESEVSRAALVSGLAGAGLEPVFMDVRAERADSWLVLIEVDGFVAPNDPRLDDIVGDPRLPVRQAQRLGGYAVPFDAAQLSSVD